MIIVSVLANSAICEIKEYSSEIVVYNGWAGESFTLISEEGKISQVRHRVMGSGIEVVSETYYELEKLNEHSVVFKINDNQFKIDSYKTHNPKIYLNGYELKVSK